MTQSWSKFFADFQRSTIDCSAITFTLPYYFFNWLKETLIYGYFWQRGKFEYKFQQSWKLIGYAFPKAKYLNSFAIAAHDAHCTKNIYIVSSFTHFKGNRKY